LRVHTKAMLQAKRLLVSDCEEGEGDLPSYEEWLRKETIGFSRATLAGVARAAASHASERAVQHSDAMDCQASQEDFRQAVEDIAENFWAPRLDGDCRRARPAAAAAGDSLQKVSTCSPGSGTLGGCSKSGASL